MANTTPLILRSFVATWERVFGFVYDDSQYIKTFGMSLPKTLRMLTEQAIAEERVERDSDLSGFSAAKAEELVVVYREFNLQWHDEMIESFDGVEETLCELRSRGLISRRANSKSSGVSTPIERCLTGTTLIL